MKSVLILLVVLSVGCSHLSQPRKIGTLVLTTDFGVKDGAVSAMKGVAHSVDQNLFISDITHEITPYHIWEAAYRLEQAVPFWRSGSVFVTVVDPGVGSKRQAIVALRGDGTIFIGPDNRHLTLIEDQQKFQAVRVIDETRHRLKGSADSYTFHGRDLFVYAGALLASGKIKFEEVGPLMDTPLQRLSYKKAQVVDGQIHGTVVVLDPNYGNVWTNIPKALVLGWGNPRQIKIEIRKGKRLVYSGTVPVRNTFAEVDPGRPLAYFNSLLNLSLALNMDNFAKKYGIAFGPEWTVLVKP